LKHELQSPEKMKFSTKKKSITKIDNRQHFVELINANPGFTQFPNFIFPLNLSKHALPVFLYLMRCANRLKDNICYPSVKNIAKNCNISSETTVSKAIKELETTGLITKNNTGRNNIYKIEEVVYLAIDKANKKDQDTSVLEATPTHSGGIESKEKGVLTIPSHSDGTPPPSDGKYHHHMVPNNTNIIKLNNNTKNEKIRKKPVKEKQ